MSETVLNETILKEIEVRVIRLLNRREHSVYELKLKMLQKSYDVSDIDWVLDSLDKQGLVSDERFSEAYSYHRKERGFGPLKVALELRERQVHDRLIDANVNFTEQYWFDSAVNQRLKKFGSAQPKNFAAKAKQIRFLQQRGFTSSQISFALDFVSESGGHG